MNPQTLTLYIKGMHCNACTLLTESEARELPYITRAHASLKHHTVELEGDFSGVSPDAVATALTEKLAPHGYQVSVEQHAHKPKWKDFSLALPIALAFAAGFVLLQKAGLVDLIGDGGLSYPTVFVIGVVASLSTCMAVVGGLVLSMSATFAKEGDRVRPQALFHLGRLVSFFVLGGVIGALGAAFTLSASATFVLGLTIALVMLVLGLNLLDVFHFSKRLQPSMPKFLARHAYGLSKLNHTLTPALVGAATFFLPCGFTQSMQIATLGAGSFMAGALTMSAFALGTLPVLALLSFSSLSIHNSRYAGVFFKTAGLIVILFALYNLASSLAAVGIINPIPLF